MLPIKLELPNGFLEGETRDGYYVKPEMKKVWAVELDLLNEFMRVCNKHNLKWYADAGTILGAVRHGGMIPWDDDIDVMMMRDQYDILCSIAAKEFNHPYFFQTEQTDPGCVRGHAQLRNSETTGILKYEYPMKMLINQGIFLDIFPIDNMPDDDNLAQKQISNIHKYRKKTFDIMEFKERYVPAKKIYKRPLKYIKKELYNIYYKLVNEKYLDYYNKYEQEAIKYNNQHTERVAKLIMTPFKKRRIWKRSFFDNTVFLPFEMFSLPVPSGYVELLDCFYGNWREYVVGTSTHGEVIFDTEKKYTEYLK